jgi:A/G-specific adenine glycosylase
MTAAISQRNFSLPLLQWFELYGRHDLPWQHPRNAYRVWVSEIMLQQTQVKTVIPYFNRFLASFPDVKTLALAAEDEVLAHWSGLGYYSRARNLRKTAAIIHADFKDEFPSNLEQLIRLPGIGPSTAAAIASLAFNQPTAILDGNVKRVLSRYFLVSGEPKHATVHQKLWQLANECMPQQCCAEYTQAIMDLGATCCTLKNPNCMACPLQTTCIAKKEDVVALYPNKNPKKSLPTKQQQFLLLHTKDHLIYLEKRPPTGLWGGLWCLPSIEMNECANTFIAQTYKLQTDNVKELMTMNHSFSHFHLQIKALSIQTKPATDAIAESPGRWFALNEINSVGLAKPVSTIINYFITHSSHV